MLCLPLFLAAAASQVVASDAIPADVQWAALAASPRIVATQGAFGRATGVCVGVKDGVAYILTAAHTLAEAAEREVQFFGRDGDPVPKAVYKQASVGFRHPASDVGLLRVAVGKDAVPVAKLAAPGERPKRFPVAVFAVGCSDGAPPTVWLDEVRRKRYERRPDNAEAFFWETGRPPVAGRSGGPLCDATGRVLGVCAANRGGYGYYTHTDELHAALKAAGFAWLWGK